MGGGGQGFPCVALVPLQCPSCARSPIGSRPCSSMLIASPRSTSIRRDGGSWARRSIRSRLIAPASLYRPGPQRAADAASSALESSSASPVCRASTSASSAGSAISSWRPLLHGIQTRLRLRWIRSPGVGSGARRSARSSSSLQVGLVEATADSGHPAANLDGVGHHWCRIDGRPGLLAGLRRLDHEPERVVAAQAAKRELGRRLQRFDAPPLVGANLAACSSSSWARATAPRRVA